MVGVACVSYLNIDEDAHTACIVFPYLPFPPPPPSPPPLIYTSAIFAISSTVLSSLPRYNDISPSTGGYYYSSPSYRYIPNAYTGIHANISREYRYSSDTNYLYSSPVIIQLPKHDCSIELFLDLFRPMRRFDLDTTAKSRSPLFERERSMLVSIIREILFSRSLRKLARRD